MNIYQIVAYILIGGLFVVSLYSNILYSQTKRQKAYKVYYLLIFIHLILFFVPAYRDNLSSGVGNDFLALGVMLPLFIARIINGRVLKQDAIKLSIDSANLIFSFISISFILFFTWMILHPAKISFDSGPIYDYEYFRTRLSALLFTIPAAMYLFLLAIERPTIVKSGIFYKGLIWDWSDFQSFSIQVDGKSSMAEIVLKTNNLWLVPEARLKAPLDKIVEAQNLLKQKVTSGSNLHL